MAIIYESPEMIGAFLDEVEEQLQLLEQGILKLEQETKSEKVIQNIFRVAHTLKGASSLMGYEKMKILTHEMENVLDKIRNNVLKVTKPIINVLFKCEDCLRLLKEDFKAHKNDTQIEITKIVDELKAILEEKIQIVETTVISENTNARDFILNNEQIGILENAILDGRNCLVCEIKILKESPMKSTRAFLIHNALNEFGKVIASNPDVFQIPDQYEVEKVKYLITTELEAQALQLRAQDELMDVEEVKVFHYTMDVSDLNEQSTEISYEQTIKKIETVEGDEPTKTEKKISQTVRVDIERLEQMMNLVGEMIIEQTKIAQVGKILHSRYISDTTVDDLMGISNHVSRVVSELQESVMKARMLPASQLFNRLPRLVRDLSHTLNKDVNLVLDGGETEMDRTIIEDITDPLIHLVRNSLDHGIEDPKVRIEKGKPCKGTLEIKAFHQENHVIITIEDDGAGLDLEKIRQSAIKKEVITYQEAESLSHHEIVNLIFETGLSTTQNVSDISGRGVGMDIVKNHIDKLNGIIDVETKEGKGTKFTIKLPLTLAILTGLLVKIHNETYAVPMNNIIEIVRRPRKDIESVMKQSVVVIRDRVHPVIWLHDYFKLPKKDKKNVFIVVLGFAEKRFGIIVDELLGNQEIVVKPLGAYIGKIEGISGATILGNGGVACIFDVAGISKMISSKTLKENKSLSNEECHVDELNSKNKKMTEEI